MARIKYVKNKRNTKNYKAMDSLFTDDDRFVMRVSIIWLSRLFDKNIKISDELLDICQWLLGDLYFNLFDEMESIIQNKSFQKSRNARFIQELVEDLKSCRLETGTRFGRTSLVDLINKCNHTVYEKMYMAIQELLKARSRELTCKTSFLERNCESMKRILNLSDIEIDLCLLLFINSNWKPIEKYFDGELDWINSNGRGTLSTVLGVNNQKLQKILFGKLKTLNIIDHKTYLSLNEEYQYFFESLDDKLLIKEVFEPINAQALPLEYYLLQNEKLNLIIKLLSSHKNTATHILLYGKPGTGKTSFAQSLAKTLNLTALKVTMGKNNEVSIRRGSVEACLNMTNNGKNALIVVDEADELLNTSIPFFRSGGQQDKGWLNELLERPGTRAIWIVNSINDIEESVRRRFVFSLHFEKLQKEQRLNLWKNILKKNKSISLLSTKK